MILLGCSIRGWRLKWDHETVIDDLICIQAETLKHGHRYWISEARDCQSQQQDAHAA